MRTSAVLISLIAGLMAGSAGAQEQPADPIGNILAQPSGQTAQVPDEPDTAAAPSATPDPDPVVAAPPAPVPQVRRPQLTEPVHVDETGKTPDGPPTVRDLAYESRIRSSFASAQSFQGPLDGAWVLNAGGADLYAFKLVDRGRGEVEGAWRDLRRKGALEGSGLIDTVERTAGDVVLRFTPAPGAATVTVTLEPAAAGWRGELVTGAERQRVSLRRAPSL